MKMGKMSIKRKRTLQHFIDVAKEIIEKEGVKQVTARKVGNYLDTLMRQFITISMI